MALSDNETSAIMGGVSIGAFMALVAVLSINQPTPQQCVAITVTSFAVTLGLIGLVFALDRYGRRFWRACVVALMVPLTLWNRAHDMNGKAYGPDEIATLVIMALPNLILCTVVAIVADRHGYALTPYAWVWAAWPIWVLVYGVVMRVGAWAVGRLRSVYAETEAELYGRAADDGDERRGGLTEVDRG